MNIGYTRRMWLSIAAVGLILSPCLALASGGGEKFVEGVNYLPIKPSLIVNYGGSAKVKYIKAEISLRVEDAHAAEEVSHHMPLIRDTLIMLISNMSDEQMGSGEGKELMRTEALEKVNEAIEAQIAAGTAGKSRKKSDHGKDDPDNLGAEKKHAKAKSKRSKPAHSGPVSDLLFDNLVIQK